MDENKILLATRNKGKIIELSDMFAKFGLKVTGLNDFPELEDVIEDGLTFRENALKKARYAAKNTGLYSIADDSGLAVDALGGAPGIYSARFSDRTINGKPVSGTDETNIAQLLAQMKGVPKNKRSARFCCAIAAVSPDGRKICTEGQWEGNIATSVAGNNGFGYDPIFIDPDTGLHVAELSSEKKNANSHRGKALTKLLAQWPDFWIA